MSTDYTLHIANSNIDEALIRKVLSSMSIEAVEKEELELGFYFYEFNPDIKTDITFIQEPDCPEGYPDNYRETMFIAHDFYGNNRLSYEFNNNVDAEMRATQYKVMFSSVMELARIANKDALFTSNGEDAFFYKNGVFFFEEEFYEAFISRQYPYEFTLGKYRCVKFDGKCLE